jgi:signal transduction histidine kinase
VGQPHIALAELIKNAYDADATQVVIRFGEDEIVVSDNGHGMTRDEFKRFWMRIGSPHKNEQRVSRRFERPLTGSKGVGRLSVQFLGSRLHLRTASEQSPTKQLEGSVDWSRAVRAKSLTSAKVAVRSGPTREGFPEGAKESAGHGTTLTLQGLNHEWKAEDFKNLAQQIWTLQPPFQAPGAEGGFEIELDIGDVEARAAFELQLRAVLGVWTARLRGDLDRDADGASRIRLSLEFNDGQRLQQTYSLEHGVLHRLNFEIRIFNLKHRQPHGIRVDDARAYFNEFGGVHVYDSSFHLPYYGADTDWLAIEMDHSHRLSRSELLPQSLQVKDGLNFLPTNSRIFGVVNVDTGYERRAARKQRTKEHLGIQVTRDRLVDNLSYKELARAVRWALDFYANREAERQQKIKIADPKPDALPTRARSVQRVLEQHKQDIPPLVFRDLEREIVEVVQASRTQAEGIAERAGLLGALATAGVSALAYEHEITKQLLLLEDLCKQLASAPTKREQKAAEQLEKWIHAARSTRRLFSHLLDDTDRDSVRAFRASSVLTTVLDQTRPFLREVEVAPISTVDDLRLPRGRFSDWIALLQNLLINAANAMIDSDDKRLLIDDADTTASRGRIRIQDSGVGVEVENSERLFEPFVRELKLSPERRALGLGGSGLGLTIVRMLAANLRCTVTFVEPDEGWSTCVQIAWRR